MQPGVMIDMPVRVEEHGFTAIFFGISGWKFEGTQIVRVWDRDPDAHCPWRGRVPAVADGAPCLLSTCGDACNANRSGASSWVCSQTVVGHVEMGDEEMARADLRAFQ